jgi:hypothetical protein
MVTVPTGCVISSRKACVKEDIMSVTDTPISRQTLGPRSGGFLTDLADFWRDLVKTIFNTYRPERHYMRGPGPACARKFTDRL